MKKLLLLPLLALCACAPKYSEFVSVADFTGYVKDGFYVYPSGTDIKTKTYVPMANIEIDFKIGEKSKISEKEGLTPNLKSMNPRAIVPSGKYMTEKAVNTAKEYGANAIINFHIDLIRTMKGDVIGYNVKGTAVKVTE